MDRTRQPGCGAGNRDELIHDEASPERLLAEAERLLQDQRAYDQMKVDLRAVRALLGEPGASRRAAEVVLAECRI